ncbi:putative holin-like toxin [Bacillus chungangensis]|uniref:Holin-like toxin n=1 Tax=Bacillus chungangensis TaxID=587633 RepID=A0ABT9WP98_9BACI|nr:putative holin-like toxin [Bacillus chungangensis]MDQ0175104.1 hypothetical protein [Bacillus chungangensis]
MTVYESLSIMFQFGIWIVAFTTLIIMLIKYTNKKK